MGTIFNFNSQVCTNIEQSERLLALGLKKETADMCHFWHWESGDYSRLCASWEFAHRSNKDIPAWSLHRLMVLAEMKGTAFSDLDSAYETTISIIAAKIRFGYFNKEYLCEK